MELVSCMRTNCYTDSVCVSHHLCLQFGVPSRQWEGGRLSPTAQFCLQSMVNCKSTVVLDMVLSFLWPWWWQLWLSVSDIIPTQRPWPYTACRSEFKGRAIRGRYKLETQRTASRIPVNSAAKQIEHNRKVHWWDFMFRRLSSINNGTLRHPGVQLQLLGYDWPIARYSRCVSSLYNIPQRWGHKV